MNNKQTKYVTGLIPLVLLVVSISLGEVKKNQPKISLDMVRDHVKRAAKICRTIKPPGRPGTGNPFPPEPGDYLKTIEPVVSAGKQSTPLLEKLVESKTLDSFETRIAQFLLARIKEPALFQKVEPRLKPSAINPLDELKYSKKSTTVEHISISKMVEGVAFYSPWQFSKPYQLELLHPDLKRTAKKHDKAFEEIESAGRKLWKDLRDSRPDTKVEKSAVKPVKLPKKSSDFHHDNSYHPYPSASPSQKKLIKMYNKRIRKISESHPDIGDDYRTLTAITFYKQELGRLLPPIDFDFFGGEPPDEETKDERKQPHLFDPKYRLAWEEAMVRPFPWYVKARIFGIVAVIDDPASAAAIAELFRQFRRDVLQPNVGSSYSRMTSKWKILETLARWPNRKTAIIFAEMLASKGVAKTYLDNNIGFLLNRSNEWKEVLSNLEKDPEMKEHLARLNSALKSYQKNKSKTEKSRGISQKKRDPLPVFPLRKWTNNTGKFSVEARLVELKQGKVQLKKANGDTISLPLNKISKADQEYVKKTLPESFPQKPTPKKPAPK